MDLFLELEVSVVCVCVCLKGGRGEKGRERGRGERERERVVETDFCVQTVNKWPCTSLRAQQCCCCSSRRKTSIPVGSMGSHLCFLTQPSMCSGPAPGLLSLAQLTTATGMTVGPCCCTVIKGGSVYLSPWRGGRLDVAPSVSV